MKLSRWVIALAVGFAFTLLLMCAGILPLGMFELVGNLLLGWIFFLARVIPQTSVNVAGVMSAALCLILLILIFHRMARWLWREMKKGEPIGNWRLRWTLSIVAIVVLMFVAGIAVVGATHQTAWLLQSGQPTWHISVAANRIKCASNLRQLGQAIVDYAQTHDGNLPDSFQTLLISGEDITSDLFVCPMSDDFKAPGATTREQADHLDESHISYVYHGCGRKMPLGADVPIACEPLSNHEGQGMNILFGDGHVDWCDPQQAEETLSRVHRAGGP